MPAKDAAKVLLQLDDTDVQTVLSGLNDRQAAAILAGFPPERAAAISRAAIRGKKIGGAS
jgi:flagellar motility protein MotE (MotC chaperone)